MLRAGVCCASGAVISRYKLSGITRVGPALILVELQAWKDSAIVRGGSNLLR
jgi:hypothetical protein